MVYEAVRSSNTQKHINSITHPAHTFSQIHRLPQTNWEAQRGLPVRMCHHCLVLVVLVSLLAVVVVDQPLPRPYFAVEEQR